MFWPDVMLLFAWSFFQVVHGDDLYERYDTEHERLLKKKIGWSQENYLWRQDTRKSCRTTTTPKMDMGHVSACFMILVNEDVTTVLLVCHPTSFFASRTSSWFTSKKKYNKRGQSRLAKIKELMVKICGLGILRILRIHRIFISHQRFVLKKGQMWYFFSGISFAPSVSLSSFVNSSQQIVTNV